MSRFNSTPSPEYRVFVEEIEAYASADHDVREDVFTTVAEALADHLCERFKNQWGVDEEAETTCIRRLITGEDTCLCERSWTNRELEQVGKHDNPPHSPPYADHATLWLDDGEPALYSMHIYPPEFQVVSKTAAPEGERRRNGWFDIVAFAEAWGLEVGISPHSSYNAFSTINVVFYPPERYR